MNYEMTGTLIEISETQQVSDSFKKREFVIEVPDGKEGKYNDFVKFQSTQDKVTLLDKYKVGDTVKVGFNIKGRKWEKEGKVNYFSNLEAWKIEAVDSAPKAKSEEEDLPF